MPHYLTIAALLAAASLLAAPRAAASEPEDPHQRLLKPGVYAVSCGHLGFGENEREALRDCDRQVRASRYVSRKRCGCKKHANIVTITQAMRPAYWVSNWTFTGPTPEAAIAACEAFERKHPDEDYSLECRASCRSAWGPFDRRHAHGQFDDETRYRWLLSNGEWVDEVGEGPCFVGDTPVMTPGGPRPIAALAVGDPVLTWPAEGVATERRARVTRVKRRTVDEILVLTLDDGRALGVTGNHPLFSMGHGRFVAAEALTVGDRLAVRLGPDELAPMAITEITRERGERDVFDVTVYPGRALFAAGVWAHNY